MSSSLSNSDQGGPPSSPASFQIVLTPVDRETAEVIGTLVLGPEDFPFHFGRRGHRYEGQDRPVKGGGILIDDEKPIQVSRDHCALEIREGRVWVVDRGSTLGTLIDRVKLGRRTAVFEQELTEGDHQLVLGNARSRHRFDLTLRVERESE